MGVRVGSTQIQRAREVNFLNFMQDRFPEMIEYSTKWKAYIHPEHDSLKYFEHGYFRFSNNDGGDGIKFLQEWCGMDFQNAVLELWQYAGGRPDNQLTYSRRNASYKAPERFEGDFKRLFAYLTSTRKIDVAIVQDLVNRKLIYEDVKHNVVFINPEPGKGIAISRSTIPMKNGQFFKKIDIEASNNYWKFEAGENPERVFICEAPIDAISLYELFKKKPGIYIAMAGLKPETVKRVISDFPDKEILLATDWDNAGISFTLRLHKELGIKFIGMPPEKQQGTKDYNEFLCLRKENKENK